MLSSLYLSDPLPLVQSRLPCWLGVSVLQTMFDAVGILEGRSVVWERDGFLEGCAEIGIEADSSCIVGQAASTHFRRDTPSVRSAHILLVHGYN